MNHSKLLIVDDDQDDRSQISRWLLEENYQSDEAENGERALRKIKHQTYSVVLLDLKMPGMDGFEVLSQIRRDYPDTCVIVITAFGDAEKVKRALKIGAFDFFDKPIKYNFLLPRIESAIKNFNLANERQYQIDEEFQKYRFENIIGKSKNMQEIFEQVRNVAAEDTTVLITGESGTGKELIASALHHNSQRANKPLIVADCGAMAEGIIESELFGHEEGAFTGAVKRKKGKIERAHGGSLFIDEVGEMSPKLQVKLLRFLQNRTFERLGGEEELQADVRIIAATNKNLEQAKEEGQFREDLFFRLNVFPIHLPPLRDRREDIPLLTEYIISKVNKKLNKRIKNISAPALEILTEYDFPGNIRELENIIERAIILEKGDSLTVGSLPANLGQTKNHPGGNLSEFAFKDAKDKFEEQYIREVLKKAKGNISQAAKLSGMDRTNFKQKMVKYGIRKQN